MRAGRIVAAALATSLRRPLAWLSAGRVLRRRLPRDFCSAPVLVTPESALRLWRFDLAVAAPELFAFVRRFVRPGDVVWDVGANVGLFTFSSATRAGRAGSAVAIEPEPFLARLLRRSAAIQPPGAAPTAVVEAAASDEAGRAELTVPLAGLASSHLSCLPGSRGAGSARRSVAIDTVTLDRLLERGHPPPTILKIDVESAEERVLRGATRVLDEARPIVLCEVRDAHAGKVGRRFSDLGYGMFSWEDRAARPLARPRRNTLFLPPERRPP